MPSEKVLSEKKAIVAALAEKIKTLRKELEKLGSDAVSTDLFEAIPNFV